MAQDLEELGRVLRIQQLQLTVCDREAADGAVEVPGVGEALCRIIAEIAPTLASLRLDCLGASAAALFRGPLPSLPHLRTIVPGYGSGYGSDPTYIARLVDVADGPLNIRGELSDDFAVALSAANAAKITGILIGAKRRTSAVLARLPSLRRVLCTHGYAGVRVGGDDLPPSIVALEVIVPWLDDHDDQPGSWTMPCLIARVSDPAWLPSLRRLTVGLAAPDDASDAAGVASLERACMERRIVFELMP